MSFNIIIRGKNQPLQSQHFRPHRNIALGHYVHTKEDYLKAIKAKDLIPYDEAKKIAEAKRKENDKPYKASAWARDMAKEIKRSGGKPGGKFYDELAKKGYDVKKMKQSAAKNKKRAEEVSRKGEKGFHND